MQAGGGSRMSAQLIVGALPEPDLLRKHNALRAEREDRLDDLGVVRSRKAPIVCADEVFKAMRSGDHGDADDEVERSLAGGVAAGASPEARRDRRARPLRFAAADARARNRPSSGRSARTRASSSAATLSGSRFNCSARSSASLVTVGCVAYQARGPSW